MLETIFDILSCLCFPFETAKERQVDLGCLDITENPERETSFEKIQSTKPRISITVTLLL